MLPVLDNKQATLLKNVLEKEFEGKEIILGIRPEDLHGEGIVADTYPTAHFDFEIEVAELLGHEYILQSSYINRFIQKYYEFKHTKEEDLQTDEHSLSDLGFDGSISELESVSKFNGSFSDEYTKKIKNLLFCNLGTEEHKNIF